MKLKKLTVFKVSMLNLVAKFTTFQNTFKSALIIRT